MSAVVVVGGGIVGAAVASACARRGARVHLCERGPLAGGASSLELALLPTGIDATRYLELHHFTGGSFLLDRSPDDWPARRIGARAAAAAVAAEARSHGAEIRTGCDVKGLLFRSGAVRGVLTDAGEIGTSRVVLAAGVDSWRLLAPHGIETVRALDSSEIVVARPPEEPLGSPLLDPDCWLAADEAGFLHVARPERAASLLSLAAEVGELARHRIDAALGVAGPVPELDGVYLAVSPDPWGIARAPEVASAVAEWLTDG